MLKNFFNIILLILFLLIIGTAGYVLIEKWSLIDSIYMTIITLTTVGYGEVAPLSYKGKIFTILFIIFGIVIFSIIITRVVNFIFQNELGIIFRRRGMQKKINKLKEFYIVCGLGDVGRVIIEEFKNSNIMAVGIDKNKEVVEFMKSKFPKYLFIVGDATEDSVLSEAGIERAKGIIAALASDIENLYVVISARNLNPKIRIIAKANDESTQIKMQKAGADYVISPDLIGALRMASVAIRPEVVSFLDIMTRNIEQTWRLEQILIPETSPLIGKTLKDVAIPAITGLLVIAVKDANQKFIYNPPANYLLSSNNTLLVLGNQEKIERLQKYIKTGK